MRRSGETSSQSGRVRRADVDDHVVRERREVPRARREVGDRLGFGDALRLADVDADDRIRRTTHEPARSRRSAVVVEAHAIDERLVARQPEQPRLRIAGLRLRGHGADLDEAKAEREHLAHVLRVLVEAGGEAERPRQLLAEHLRAQSRIARRIPAPREPSHARDREREVHHRHRPLMGRLGG
jgi:hypothetical protein